MFSPIFLLDDVVFVKNNCMKEFINHYTDKLKGKIPAGSKRSGKWPEVRRAFLLKSPKCAVCGGDKNIQVHHKMPFHLHPELELSELNLITLCEKPGTDCHLMVGHLHSFKSYNPNVVEDAAIWYQKILNRPKDGES
jgi:5-methylcytosine-specific restriction protein A